MPSNNCVVYECEASGYCENPLTDHHVVALNVRLLRRVTREEWTRASQAWESARYTRQRAEDNRKRLDKARASAIATKANRAAARKAGVESPAMTAFRLLVELTPAESWRDVNTCRYQALKYATRFLRFDPEDADAIISRFKGGYWIGENGAEKLYALAIEHKNLSAVVAWEKYLGRKPWWATVRGERARLTLGAHFRWQGVDVKVTSFKGDESFVACSYKAVTVGAGTRYEREDDKIDRRFTITREAFNAAFKKKPALATA